MSTNLNDLNINLGNELTIRRTEVTARSTQLKKMSDTYAEHAKLVFCFDVSGSMNEVIAKSFVGRFAWTDAKVAEIRQRTSDAISRINANMGAATCEEDMKLAPLADDLNGAPLTFCPLTDNDLKERVIRKGLTAYFGVKEIDRYFFGEGRKDLKTRLQVVQTLAKQEIRARFDKYPNSRLAVIPFGSFPAVIFDDGAPDDLWPKLDQFSVGMEGTGGGTDILSALRAAMDVCRAKPSAVGIHHFIVVSDGEDSQTEYAIGSWVPAFKASGVVLDYIHIGDTAVNPGIKAACIETGGECVAVEYEDDLQEKFIAAVNRLCLPAPETK